MGYPCRHHQESWRGRFTSRLTASCLRNWTKSPMRRHRWRRWKEWKRGAKVTSEASNSILDTTTTLYCHHHGEGNPSMLLPVHGIEAVSPRISKPDDRTLRTAGVATIRKSKKDFHARMPLNLYFLRKLGHKIFEIHCDEGCSMIDVLQHLSRKYVGDSVTLLIDALMPDDDYTMVHSDLVTVRPGRFSAQKLPLSNSQLTVSDKVRNRSRCLYSVYEIEVT